MLEAEQGHLSHAAVGCTKQAGRGRNGEVAGKACFQLDCNPQTSQIYVCVCDQSLMMAVKERPAASSAVDYRNASQSLFPDENSEHSANVLTINCSFTYSNHLNHLIAV